MSSKHKKKPNEKPAEGGNRGVVLVLLLALGFGFQLHVATRTLVASMYDMNADSARRKTEGDREISNLKKSASWSPNSFDVWYRMGTFYMEANDLSSAKQTLSNSLQLAPHHLGANLAMAELHAFSGDFDTAQQYLAGAKKIAPTSWRVHRSAAVIAGIQGDHQVALNELTLASAFSSHPEADLYTDMSVAELALDEPERAIAWSKRALKIKKDDEHAFLLQGKSLLVLERYEDAVPMLKRATALVLKANKDALQYSDALLHLAQAQYRTGDMLGAAESLELAAPTASTLVQLRDLAETRLVEFGAVLSEAALSKAEAAQIDYRVGVARLLLGDYEFAEQLLADAAPYLEGEDLVKASVFRANVLQKMNRSQDAIKVLRSVALRDPGLLGVRLALADLLREQGLVADARLEYALILQDFTLDKAIKQRVKNALDEL